MIFSATHITRHLYESPVSQSINELRLTPRSLPGQRLRDLKIHIDPEPVSWHRRRDYFGNEAIAIAIYEPHKRFEIRSESIVEVLPPAPGPAPSISWEEARDRIAAQADEGSAEAMEFIFDSPFVSASAELADYARPTFTSGRPLVEALRELTQRIHTEFQYKPNSTSIDIPLLEVLRNRCGVCQDFAHIMIGALRSLRLAARYNSGYLRSSPSIQGAEASHAWLSAYVPGSGWLSFDPTNDAMPNGNHLIVAWGRDYGDVPPVKGVAVGGGEHTIEVEVNVVPLEQS